MWKIGDKFRFVAPNSLGGKQFGCVGDIGELIAVSTDYRGMSFKFASLNEADDTHLGFRRQYLERQTRIGGYFKEIERLIINYRADQVADEAEDLL